MKKIYFLFCLNFIYSFSSAQLIVVADTNIIPLIQNSLLGPGVVVTNVKYTGVPNSIGSFTDSAGLGMSNGMVLCTGQIFNLGMPGSYFQSDPASAPGDSDIQNLIGAGGAASQDAAVLEFDFKVQGDSVKFNFIFGSEEYNDYVPGPGNPVPFNDMFGFFISGPGITGNQNIALIPGTSDPVSIATVNNGYSSGVSTGPCMNCNYFVDNVAGSVCSFDGLTTVLTATSAVQPCTFYHIKLAVANVGDGAFDSGVFLEANSFTPCGPLSVFNGLASIGDTVSICMGDTITLSSCKAPNYTWTTGDTTQTIQVSQPATYWVTVNEGSCSASSAHFTVVTDTTLSKPLIYQNGNLLSSSVNDSTLDYQWFKNGVSVSNSNNPQLLVSSGGCYKVFISRTGGCKTTSDSICITFAGVFENSYLPFSVLISPDPNNGNATISFENKINDLFIAVIYNASGKIIARFETHDNFITMNNDNLNKGVYFIELENVKSGFKSRNKFLVIQ